MIWINKISMRLLRITATASLHRWCFGFTLFAYSTQVILERIRWLHSVTTCANPLAFARYTLFMQIATQTQTLFKLGFRFLLAARIARILHFRLALHANIMIAHLIQRFVLPTLRALLGFFTFAAFLV